MHNLIKLIEQFNNEIDNNKKLYILYDIYQEIANEYHDNINFWDDDSFVSSMIQILKTTNFHAVNVLSSLNLNRHYASPMALFRGSQDLNAFMISLSNRLLKTGEIREHVIDVVNFGSAPSC